MHPIREKILAHIKQAMPTREQVNVATIAALIFIRRKLRMQRLPFEERTQIIEYVSGEGRMTSRYSLMAVLSCGVATMGLLQSSPAVVIGAMLMSPLMSPIMALGFGLCVMDLRLVRKSLEALLIGTVMSIAVSFILVSLSPLNDPTPEILARTSPNLLDLVIAVFSAIAGGYAVIKRKGETLVGVAIATALMPPLAVVGYGLATGKAAVATGSFFLFMTNLLAIALTVTLLALWYGFATRQTRHYSKWQIIAVLLVFAILSFPLGSSLKNIASETVTTRTARGIISDYFAKATPPARVELFHIAFGQDDEVTIETVVLTKQYDTDAQDTILAKLEPALERKVTLAIDQLVISKNPERAKSLAMQVPQNALAAPVSPVDSAIKGKSIDSLTMLRDALPIPADVAPVSDSPSAFVIRPKPVTGGNLGLYRKMEEDLSGRFDTLHIKIIPPTSRLADIEFPYGSDALGKTGLENLENAIWALDRWGIAQVELIAYDRVGASQPLDNARSLPARRSSLIATRLDAHGIASTPHMEKGTSANDYQKITLALPAEPEEGDAIEE